MLCYDDRAIRNTTPFPPSLSESEWSRGLGGLISASACDSDSTVTPLPMPHSAFLAHRHRTNPPPHALGTDKCPLELNGRVFRGSCRLDRSHWPVIGARGGHGGVRGFVAISPAMLV